MIEAHVQSTEQIVSVDGVPCRVWRATTADGREFEMLVHRVKVHMSVDQAEFERELREVPAVEVPHADAATVAEYERRGEVDGCYHCGSQLHHSSDCRESMGPASATG